MERSVYGQNCGCALADFYRRRQSFRYKRIRGRQRHVSGGKGAAGFSARKLFSLTSTQFNSEAQTPILFQNHLFAVSSKTRGRFTCLDLDGKVVWQSPVVSGNAEASRTFDLGGFLLADGMFFILDGNTGMLRLVEASTKEYIELASAQILSGEDVWGPMALSDGKLIIRDMSQMVCLQVGRSGGGKK